MMIGVARTFALHLAAALLVCACGEPPPPARSPEILRIEVIPDSVSVAVGREIVLVARVLDAEGNALDAANVAWKSAAPEIATVNLEGVVSGQRVGETNISASVEGTSGTAIVRVIAPEPERIEISPENPTILIGEQLQLTARVLDDSGNELAGQTLSWNSTNPAVATVDGAGVVTAVQQGQTTVRVTAGEVQAIGTVVVEPKPLARIELLPAALELQVGDTARVVPQLYDEAGTRIEGADVHWAAQDPAVVTIDDSGLVTAISAGQSRITASAGGVSAHASVTVVPIAAASVDVVSPVQRYFIGTTIQLEARVRDRFGNELTDRQVSWSVSDPAIAEIEDNGLLRPRSPGLVTVSASVESASGALVLRVEVPVDRVVISESTLELLRGEKHVLTAQVLAPDGSTMEGKRVTWATDAPDVAAVDQLGTVEATGAGQTTIRAEVDGVSAAVTVGVTALRFTDVEVGGRFSCGLAVDGRAWCWGALPGSTGYHRPSHVPTLISDAHEFAEISAGAAHLCGLTSTGEAWCLGQNLYGELGDGTTAGSDAPVRVLGNHQFRKIYAGNSYTCAIDEAGAAWCWGSNYVGELGTGDNQDATTPRRVSTTLAFTSLATSQEQDAVNFTCGVTTTDEIWCWGDNGAGQLGDGTTEASNVPVRVSSLLPFSDVSVAGYYGAARPGEPRMVRAHSCALTTAGAAWCWGSNSSGQLGTGTGADSPIPVAVSGATSLQSISVSGGFVVGATCALAADGGAWCWGANEVGELGNGQAGAGQFEALPVAVSGQHAFERISRGRQTACAVTAQGVVWCWGDNLNLQAGTTNFNPAVPTIVFGQ